MTTLTVDGMGDKENNLSGKAAGSKLLLVQPARVVMFIPGVRNASAQLPTTKPPHLICIHAHHAFILTMPSCSPCLSAHHAFSLPPPPLHRSCLHFAGWRAPFPFLHCVRRDREAARGASAGLKHISVTPPTRLSWGSNRPPASAGDQTAHPPQLVSRWGHPELPNASRPRAADCHLLRLIAIDHG